VASRRRAGDTPRVTAALATYARLLALYGRPASPTRTVRALVLHRRIVSAVDIMTPAEERAYYRGAQAARDALRRQS
jgi:hypothetical protein